MNNQKTTNKKQNEDKIFRQALEHYPIDFQTGKKFFKLVKDTKSGGYKTNSDGRVKIEGKHLGLRLQEKDAFEPTFLKWIEMQDNFTNAVKYLIEQDILLHNGPRNLSQFVPSVRNLEQALQDQREAQIQEASNSTTIYPNTPVPNYYQETAQPVARKEVSNDVSYESPVAVQKEEPEEKQVSTPVNTVVEEQVGTGKTVIERTIEEHKETPASTKNNQDEEKIIEETNVQKPTTEEVKPNDDENKKKKYAAW